jgi:ATP-dependent HslUV protease, peptidase subunit HslV
MHDGVVSERSDATRTSPHPSEPWQSTVEFGVGAARQIGEMYRFRSRRLALVCTLSALTTPLPRTHATTILGVCRNGAVALAGDGQVTFGEMIVKHGARKIRILHDGEVIAGFAGAVADAMTLFEKFEIQLRDAKGDLRRASVELAKEWRTDRYLRRLEAQLIVADTDQILVLSGEGDVIQPDDGIVAIGTGAPYAMAAARALALHTQMSPREIVSEAMAIAADLCIFTNDRIVIESAPGMDEPTSDTNPPEPAKPASGRRKARSS